MDNKDIWDQTESNKIHPSTLFVVCILLGVIAIIGATFIENIWVNIGVPLGIMAYYTYSIRQDVDEVLSDEQKADSVYYMGFIFTLVAMTASLVALAESEEIRFNTIVANFGLALATTIVGLTVRIVWLQMNSQDLEDADAILRDRLIKMSNKLADNNEKIVSRLTALAGQMETVSEPLKNNLESLVDSFKLADQIEAKLLDFNASVEMASENVEELAGSLEALNPEFSDLNKNAKDAVEIPRFIVSELNELKREAASLVERSKELALTAEQIDEEASKATKSTILGLEKSLKTFDKAIDQANSLMDSNAEHIGNYLSDSKSALDDANKMFLDGAKSIKDGNKAISKALKNSAKQIEDSLSSQDESNKDSEDKQD